MYSENQQNQTERKSCGPPPIPLGPPVRVRVSRLAISALVLGICSLPCVITAIPAMILAVMGMRRIDATGGRVSGKGMASLGFALACLGIALWILMLMLNYVRNSAFQINCGINLADLGRAIQIYSSDYDGDLPRAGGENSVWTGSIPDWKAQTRQEVFGLNPDGSGGQVSITASLYLLVKHTEALPKSFVCIDERGKTKEFVPAKYGVQESELTEIWDFGPVPEMHCSYAYQMPYGKIPMNLGIERGLAIMADRNPWQAGYRAKGEAEWDVFDPDGTYSEQLLAGNASRHKDKTRGIESGQNVLFLDAHAEFTKKPTVGINDDNIYTSWNGEDIRKGIPPTIGSEPASKQDSLLVNDGEGTVRE